MIALVTGAGSGIGNRLAELLLARGDQVIALDVKFSEPARAGLEHAGSSVHFEAVDVRDGAAVAAAVAAGVAALGAPRLVINSAGVVIAVPFEETDEEAFRRVVDINLYGSRNVAAATLPHLKNGGHLVLIASLAGFVANYGYSAYCASKFGVVGLAEVLRLEQKPNGVAVSVVAPPEVMTPMVEEERRSGSRLTGELKQFAGSMELEPAAEAILEGIDGGGFLIVPSIRGRSTRLLNRLAPSPITHAISDRLLRKAQKSG
ncbi:MAG: SDR family NAD(P)-dependent oxidoreductase [Thermoleophilaceae bacterium]|nr:SDR family NAD(P)-dependent oxidoreductase [Thermoleophilaceae bacterium]